MADPRILGVEQRQKKANLSPLMLRKSQETTGEKVNVCPFGCEAEDLDEHGYCDHLIGFTRDKKFYEPQVMNPLTERREVVGSVRDPKTGKMVPNLLLVKQSDQLVQITDCYRVYRNIDKEAAKSA
jgi:hypothetical protein